MHKIVNSIFVRQGDNLIILVAISTDQFYCSKLLFTNNLDKRVDKFSLHEPQIIKSNQPVLADESLGEHKEIDHLHKHYILYNNITHVRMNMHGVSDSSKLFHWWYNIWLQDKMSCLCIFLYLCFLICSSDNWCTV